QEERVVPEDPEVVEADPLRRRDAVPAREGVVDDAPEWIADEDPDERDRRRRVGEAPDPVRSGAAAARSTRPRNGPVEGVWGNREVPPAGATHAQPVTDSASS